MIVLSLWAIDKIVVFYSFLIVSYIRTSVSWSIYAVASSKITQEAFLNRALATHNSCFYPADRLSPLGAIYESNPADYCL